MGDADVLPIFIGTEGGTIFEAAVGVAVIGPYS